MSNNILNGIMGLVVADALGVPVEFQTRQSLKDNPVVNMRAFGTYNQPAGTWSDDSSMTLALLDSLNHGLNYKAIMDKFLAWYKEGFYTPHGKVFDIGLGTSQALEGYKSGIKPLEAGGISEYDNGNGSLMRILPILFYLQAKYGSNFTENHKAFEIIHNISALTHRHKRSQMACGIYISIASSLLTDKNLVFSVQRGIANAMQYYHTKQKFKEQLPYFSRIQADNFKELTESEIQSGGYVVDTLEAAIWCLLTTEDYKSCVLKAVNLGIDTDTTAAVAGGLAGLTYGYESIPTEWIKTLAKKDYIEKMCNDLYSKLSKINADKLLSYIPYFETASKSEVCTWSPAGKRDDGIISLPHVSYDHELSKFVKDFYESDLIAHDYLNIINRDQVEKEGIDKYIADADLELLKAILTYYIRGERFCEGLWIGAVEDKIFLKILYRLREIILK